MSIRDFLRLGAPQEQVTSPQSQAVRQAQDAMVPDEKTEEKGAAQQAEASSPRDSRSEVCVFCSDSDSDDADRERWIHSESGTLSMPSPSSWTAGGVTPPGGHWSVGSLLHVEGTCKPCGFFWRSMGCKDGANCKHCHICTPEDKKQRRKDRKQLAKKAKRRSRGVHGGAATV